MIAKRCGALVFVTALLAAGTVTHAANLNCIQSEPHPASSLAAQQPVEDYERPVSVKLLFPNFLCDQKAIWLFPTKVASNGNWIPTVAIAGTTAALFTLDPTEGRYFHETSSFKGLNKVLTGTSTAAITVAVPVTLFATGLLRKDSKMQQTALLAGEAVADAEVVSAVLKAIDGRTRPATFQRGGNYWDSWFEKPGVGNFPSGHAVASFAIATVVAHRYRNHRWVPYAAYGAAALLGISRITDSAHFASDVFLGAALGYTVSRFAVLRY